MLGFQNLIETFLNLFHFLSRTAKRVFRYLHAIGRTCRGVFPSQETIAEKCLCSERHVRRILIELENRGWIVRMKRPYQSTMYLIPEQLLNLDLRNPKVFNHPKEKFSSENVRLDVPVFSYSFGNDERYEKQSCVQPKKVEKEKEIPLEIEILPIDSNAKRTLSYYPEQIFQLALEDARTYRNRTPIKNVAAFIISRCKAYFGKK